MKNKKTFLVLLGILFSVIILYLNDWLIYPFILIASLLMICSIFMIHEIGHMITGLLIGYNFISLTLGPILILKEKNRRLRVLINFKNMFEWRCIMEAKLDEYYKDKNKYILYLAGGSITNFIVVLLSIVLFILTDNILYTLIAVLNSLIGITALLPYLYKNYFTDGLGIKVLLANNENSRLYFSLLKVLYLSISTTDVNKMDENQLESIEKDFLTLSNTSSDNIVQITLMLSLLHELVIWHLMNERYQKCLQLIEPFINDICHNDILQEDLIIAYLYSKVAVEHKADPITCKLDVKKPYVDSVTKLKIDAFKLLNKNEKIKALETLNSAKNEVKARKLALNRDFIDITILNNFKKIIEKC